MYSEKVMDHFTNPRNVGEIADANAVGEVGNPTCGDIMRIYMKIEDGVITDVKFKTFGCGAAVATSSMATEMVKGKTIAEALALTNKAVAEALDGLPPIKMHCSVLAEDAIKAALIDYYKRQGIDPKPIVGFDSVAEMECCHGDLHEACQHALQERTKTHRRNFGLCFAAADRGRLPSCARRGAGPVGRGGLGGGGGAAGAAGIFGVRRAAAHPWGRLSQRGRAGRGAGGRHPAF